MSLLGKWSGPKFVSFYLWQNVKHLSILVPCLSIKQVGACEKGFFLSRVISLAISSQHNHVWLKEVAKKLAQSYPSSKVSCREIYIYIIVGKLGIKIPSMHKNKYKMLYSSRIMFGLHYVGKQSDEIKKCRPYGNPDRVHGFRFHDLSLRAIDEKSRYPCFSRK